MKYWLLTILVLMCQTLSAQGPDPAVTSHPLFDDRLKGIDILAVPKTMIFATKSLRPEQAQVVLTQETIGEIVGRDLFPGNYKLNPPQWAYYIQYTRNGQTHYGWVSDSDFRFTDEPFRLGAYRFSWVPENKVYPQLNRPDLSLMIQTTDNSQFKLDIGYSEDEEFFSYATAIGRTIMNKNYVVFTLLNCQILIPLISRQLIAYVYLRNPYEGLPNVPEIEFVEPPLKTNRENQIMDIEEHYRIEE